MLRMGFLVAHLVKNLPPGEPGLIPGWGRSAGEGIGYPPQYSWGSLVAQLVQTLPSMQTPGFNPWVGKISWRREWLPTTVCWPGEFHGLYSPWGCKESDVTEQLLLTHSLTHAKDGRVDSRRSLGPPGPMELL